MYQFKKPSPSYTKDSDHPARWKISSNWRNFATVRKYLILKWVYNELTMEEYRLVLDTMSPSYDMFMIVVKLFHKLKSKKAIGAILNKYFSTNDKESYNIQVYKLLRAEAKKSLKIEIFFTKRRKGIKYSGWRRSHNDHGSIGPEVEKEFQYIIPDQEENLEQKMFQTLLSVSESSALQISQAERSLRSVKRRTTSKFRITKY